MNTEILQGKWHQLKGSVKAQWGKLTDDELDQVDGNAEKLVGLVQERYGYAKQRAEQEVDSFLARQKSDVVRDPLSAPSLRARCQRPLG